MAEKIVLAYSGGLDTSVAIPWLAERFDAGVEITPDEVLLFAGGIIPDRDLSFLEKAGVARVFQPGARTEEIVSFLSERLASKAR